MRLIAIEKFFRDLGDIITNILFYRFPIRNNYRYLTNEANYSIIDLKINSIPYFEQVFQDSIFWNRFNSEWRPIVILHFLFFIP